jgi:hypothetical protein
MIPLRAMMTISHPGSIRGRCALAACRSRRLVRLRTTALPIRLLAEKPIRVRSRSFLHRQRTIWRLDQQRPLFRTRPKSAGLLKRCFRDNTLVAYPINPSLDLAALARHGQLLAALGAARIDHTAPTCCAHAPAKAVHAHTSTFLGLPCSLGHQIPP